MCAFHVNDELIEDFRKGGDLFQRMMKKLKEAYPSLEDAKRAYEAQHDPTKEDGRTVKARCSLCGHKDTVELQPLNTKWHD